MINEQKELMLGGIKQSILLRGKEDLPILLFLHGGPGTAQIGFMPNYQDELEKHFLVVNWDQRGSGLSYVEGIPEETMHIRQFMDDAIELVQYLTKEYKKKKIYLIGHSWGSMLGLLLIKKYPNFFSVYIGVGQVSNMIKGEKYLYNHILKKAKEDQLEEALQDLNEIGLPPYKNPFISIPISRKWVHHYGGVTKDLDLNNAIVQGIKESPYYQEEDLEKWINGNNFSIQHMLEELLSIDLEEDIKEVEVPVYFIGGRHDYTTPSKVAYEYLEKLKAPKKKFIWFEESAHMPMMEEPKLFQETVINLFVE